MEKPLEFGFSLGSRMETSPNCKCWKLGVFWADRERIRCPSVWGNSRFLGWSRVKPTKCGDSGVSKSSRATNIAHVRVWKNWGFHAQSGDGSQ
jgi:hypothetical protein